jgi:glycosyltransferase involved in cell wall biosynthesis
MIPLKVCIIGLKCFDHLARKPVPRYIGGIETQLAVLAKGLHREGCDVSVVTFDNGEPQPQVFDGVKVIKSYKTSGGIRGLRWFGRAKSLCSAMRQADADIYLQMGAGDETAVTHRGRNFQSTSARKFVFCLASNSDCEGVYGTAPSSWQSRLYRYGVRRADLVVSQTEHQRAGLKKSLGIESVVVPMAVRAPVPETIAHSAGNEVIWIGRIAAEKRFDWLLEVARNCPELRFNVVGTPNSESGYATTLLAEANKRANVTVHGRVSSAELETIYTRTSVLCSTSLIEGFPTTFLEAWSRAIPVITTFDPDGVISRNGLGAVAKTAEEIAGLVRTVPKSPAYAAMAKAARDYYHRNHSVEAASKNFSDLFLKLASHARNY